MSLPRQERAPSSFYVKHAGKRQGWEGGRAGGQGPGLLPCRVTPRFICRALGQVEGRASEGETPWVGGGFPGNPPVLGQRPLPGLVSHWGHRRPRGPRHGSRRSEAACRDLPGAECRCRGGCEHGACGREGGVLSLGFPRPWLPTGGRRRVGGSGARGTPTPAASPQEHRKAFQQMWLGFLKHQVGVGEGPRGWAPASGAGRTRPDLLLPAAASPHLQEGAGDHARLRPASPGTAPPHDRLPRPRL